MPAIINFKICDNAIECNGLAICPVKAITWNEKKKTLEINNKKCISCGKCEDACLVGAIRVAKTAKEFEKIKKEIKNDPRKASNLFIDRYGATPIQSTFVAKQNEFNTHVLRATKLTAVEFFDENSIMCLLNSIPVKDLFGETDLKYRKVQIENNDLMKKYKIKKLPALLFFNKGKNIGKIEGYYNNKNKIELIKKVNQIIK